jgi:hypothetical protein
MVPKSDGQQKMWDDNRAKAYNGSFRHFLTSLANRQLREQGFLVKPAIETVDAISPGRELFVEDADLLLPSEKPFELKFRSGSDLYVEYINERNVELNAPRTQRTEVQIQNQLSQVRFLVIPVPFYTDGYLVNPLSMMVYGYWSREGVADELPRDYQPSGPGW